MQFSAHDYQRFAIDYILTHPVTAAILDMGLGKTVITLSAIHELLSEPEGSGGSSPARGKKYMAGRD